MKLTEIIKATIIYAFIIAVALTIFTFVCSVVGFFMDTALGMSIASAKQGLLIVVPAIAVVVLLVWALGGFEKDQEEIHF